MSEHKWIAKYRNCSFRGRHGKRGGSQFPRHQMNLFEGTHLGMRQHYKREWHDRGGAALHSKYIIGLLNLARSLNKSFNGQRLITVNKLDMIRVKNRNPITNSYDNVSLDVMKSISSLSSTPRLIGISKFINKSELGNRIVILDGVQDPGNIGTIIRNSVAFDVDTIVLSLITTSTIRRINTF